MLAMRCWALHGTTADNAAVAGTPPAPPAERLPEPALLDRQQATVHLGIRGCALLPPGLHARTRRFALAGAGPRTCHKSSAHPSTPLPPRVPPKWPRPSRPSPPAVENGHIKRVTDEHIHSSVLEVAGANVSTAYITCPADPGKTLGIKLPFLVMIVKNLNKYFTFEVQVGDHVTPPAAAKGRAAMTLVQGSGCHVVHCVPLYAQAAVVVAQSWRGPPTSPHPTPPSPTTTHLLFRRCACVPSPTCAYLPPVRTVNRCWTTRMCAAASAPPTTRWVAAGMKLHDASYN